MPPAIGYGAGVRRAHASLCGIQAYTTGRAPALEEGSWPRCKICQRLLANAPRR